MLMPPYIYIPTNVFTIKSEQKNKNQRKCSFCLCFFNKYVKKIKKNSVLVLDQEHISDAFDGKFTQEW